MWLYPSSVKGRHPQASLETAGCQLGGACRTLQDSPGTGEGALGSTLDKHHCSQHRSSELAEKLVCSGVGLLISLFC